MGHARPAVALVLAHPQTAGGGAEGEALAARVEGERMAIDDVVGVRLRQALAQDIEAAASGEESTKLYNEIFNIR